MLLAQKCYCRYETSPTNSRDTTSPSGERLQTPTQARARTPRQSCTWLCLGPGTPIEIPGLVFLGLAARTEGVLCLLLILAAGSITQSHTQSFISRGKFLRLEWQRCKRRRGGEDGKKKKIVERKLK